MLSIKDCDGLNYILSEEPFGVSKISQLNLAMNNGIKKEGIKLLVPGLKANPNLVSLNLSSCGLGVSGCVQIAQVLESNTTIKNLNLFNNASDVDGARALG